MQQTFAAAPVPKYNQTKEFPNLAEKNNILITYCSVKNPFKSDQSRSPSRWVSVTFVKETQQQKKIKKSNVNSLQMIQFELTGTIYA